MADELTILIFKRIASKKDCTFEDIRQVTGVKRWHMGDTPISLLMQSLKDLAKWGLIQATDSDDKVVAFKNFKRTIPKNIRFRLTDRAFQIEGALDIKLTRPPQPIFGKPDDSVEYPRVFVLMPFADEYLSIYQDHIKTVSERRGLSCGRADDLFGPGSIISEIWSAINRADVIVADCTGRNPNVFYEIGIAHTLGKPTILISQTKSDVPFDIGGLRIIFYENTEKGLNELDQALDRFIRRVEKIVAAEKELERAPGPDKKGTETAADEHRAGKENAETEESKKRDGA
jgi:hypothetical protein